MSTYPVIQLETPTGVITFAGEQVLSAAMVQELHPLAVELQGSSIEFLVINTDEDFSIFSESNLLTERMPLLVYENINGGQMLLGRFFLADWENLTDWQMKFEAVDWIGVMEKIDFDGIFWPIPVTVAAALAQVLTPAGVPFEVSAEAGAELISGWIPPGKLRDALQQICFASGATATTARRENILITPAVIPGPTSFQLIIEDSERLEAKRGPKLAEQVDSIQLVSHDYSQGTEEVTEYEKSLAAGSHKVVFSQPYYSIEIDGPGFESVVLAMEDGPLFALEDGSYLEVAGEFQFGVNSVVLNLSSPGLVTITGIPWIDSKQSHPFVEAGVDNVKNSLPIEKATLVNAERAPRILALLRDYYRQRFVQEMTLLPGTSKPKDVVVTGTSQQKLLVGAIHRQELDLSGGFLMRTTIRGVQLIPVPPMEDPYRRPRCGVAVCGADLTDQNLFREYA